MSWGGREDRSCSFTLSSIRRLWSLVVNAMSRPLYTRKNPSKQYRRLGGPQSQSEWMWIKENFILLLGFKPLTFQPVASRYTDYTIPPLKNCASYAPSWFKKKKTVSTWNKLIQHIRIWNFTIYIFQKEINTLLCVIRLRCIFVKIYSSVIKSEVSRRLKAVTFFSRSAVWMPSPGLFHTDMAKGQILSPITWLIDSISELFFFTNT